MISWTCNNCGAGVDCDNPALLKALKERHTCNDSARAVDDALEFFGAVPEQFKEER